MSPATAPFLSYSANQEDVIINRVFRNSPVGFYVDVGAAHPLFENDTKALYDRGWRGINIEPNVGFFRALDSERPRDTNLNVAVSDEPGELVFYEVIGTGLSTCDPEDAERAATKGFEVIRHGVQAMTLQQILTEALVPNIDLLKVDVEGFELKVMASNDWTRFRPRLILAEATYPESPVRRDSGVRPFLEGQGYRHVYFDGLNDFYVERTFEPAVAAFDTPPNIFDNFQPLGQHLLLREKQDLLREKVGLEAQLEGLRQERENARVYSESLDSELHRTRVAYEAAHEDKSRALAELGAMRERGRILATEMDKLTMRLVLAEAAAVELGRVYASTSWRITRPLRAMMRPRRTLGVLLGHRAL